MRHSRQLLKAPVVEREISLSFYCNKVCLSAVWISEHVSLNELLGLLRGCDVTTVQSLRLDLKGNTVGGACSDLRELTNNSRLGLLGVSGLKQSTIHG